MTVDVVVPTTGRPSLADLLLALAAGRGPRPGRDLQVVVELDLQEAARETIKELTIPREEICSECSGTGARRGTRPSTCRRCVRCKWPGSLQRQEPGCRSGLHQSTR